MARSLVQAHERVKSLEWEHSYHTPPDRYPTKYHIPAKTKDPFRHLLRDFLTMEREKDDRAYGGLQDVLARTDAVNESAPEFTEVLKPVLPALRDGEYGAMQAMIHMVEMVPNPELRQGYMAQELDEIRHIQAEAWLARYYAKNYFDPCGFNCAASVREWHPLLMAVRNGVTQFMDGDPVRNCLNLQIVAETAYTNPVFVAVTDVAARSGDKVLPSLFLSIQSDEGRHMANGYSTLSAVLSDDRNLEMLQQDLDEAFFHFHRPLDPFLGVIYDYFRDPNANTRCFADYWDEYIWHDWAGSYMAKLEKFGIHAPAYLERARADVRWMGHTAGLFLYALWPLNFWRMSPVPESSFDWFESNYPGWYSYFGPFWEDAVEKADPANGTLALEAFPEMPPICRVCDIPTILPRIDKSEYFETEYGGRHHYFCSETCLGEFNREPERHVHHTNFGERYAGWDLADIIVDMGLLRPDGKTLIGQPTLDDNRMWTIDDIRKIGWEIKYPYA